MKSAEIEIGRAYLVEREGYHAGGAKATVLEKGVPIPKRRTTGVRIVWDESRGKGGRYGSTVAGEEEFVLSRRVLRPWTEDDDAGRHAEVEQRESVAEVERRLANLGVIRSEDCENEQRKLDAAARAAARERGDDDWFGVEAEPLDRPHAEVGPRVSMPLETLEFLLDRLERDA